jgi:hypothetical protein
MNERAGVLKTMAEAIRCTVNTLHLANRATSAVADGLLSHPMNRNTAWALGTQTDKVIASLLDLARAYEDASWAERDD